MEDLLERLEKGLEKLEACGGHLYDQTFAQLEDITEAIEDIVGK